ncbi:hypothetical protein R3P38DRAFT_2807144 [Favolaschia claudopus]|uniref:Uncharacterized protein n=1 Tax=Favolaschia claudopus TaxID=2862362 RepID=A0AAV9ZHY7_9AGAR
MFLSASIAVVSVLSLSAFTAPLPPRRVNPQFCTGTNGSGTCKPINIGSCTETPDVQSLVLNAAKVGCGLSFPNCKSSSGEAPPSDDSQSIILAGGALRVCLSSEKFEGTVSMNGFTKGSKEDIGG